MTLSAREYEAKVSAQEEQIAALQRERDALASGVPDNMRRVWSSMIEMQRKQCESKLAAQEEQIAALFKMHASLAEDRKAAIDALSAQEEQIERLKRCISMAMGCINPEATDRDLRLAWFRLADALDGKEPRAALEGSKHDG